MPKPWDDSMRTLIRTNPQAFVKLIFPDARSIKGRSEKLRNWQLEVDALVEVVVGEGQEMLIHFEFQTYHDGEMPVRLLRYNVLVRSEYDLPVLSCVIYLLKDGNVRRSPLRWAVPTGHNVLEFHFLSIELADLTPQELLGLGEINLLPLLPLTKGGEQREVVEEMFTALQANEHENLALIAFQLASLVFRRTNSTDLDWLQRRFWKLHDIMRETPVYQWILQEGREEGLKEGLKALHLTIVDIVQQRFPQLASLAETRIASVNDITLLRELIVKTSLAENQEEVRQQLLAIGKDTE